MKDTHDIFREASLESAKKIFGSNKGGNEKGKGNDDDLFFLLLVLLFVGSEGMNVIFRKGFGRNGLNLGMIIGCFLSLAGVSAYSFYAFSHPEKRLQDSEIGNSYFITGFLFSTISLYILAKGILHILSALKRKDLSENAGEAFLLRFLKKDKWSDNQIKYIAEPALIICFGVNYSFFNLLGGLSLIVMASSVWGRLIVEKVVLGNSIVQMIKGQVKTNSKNRVK